MPVFYRVHDNILTVTVDGDFGPGEVARKGREALDSGGFTGRVGVLLDVSGAAGMDPSEVIEMALVFFEHPTEVPRIAVLGSEETARAQGVEIRGFYHKSQALEWLKG